MEIGIETLPREEIKYLPDYTGPYGELPDGLEDSIKALGFVVPVVVSEDKYLLDGYKRMVLNWIKEYPAIVLKGLKCQESQDSCRMVRLLLNNERKAMTKEEKMLLVTKVMLEVDYTPEEADRLLRGEVPNPVVKKVQEKLSFELSPSTLKRYIKSALESTEFQKLLLSKSAKKGEVKIEEVKPSAESIEAKPEKPEEAHVEESQPEEEVEAPVEAEEPQAVKSLEVTNLQEIVSSGVAAVSAKIQNPSLKDEFTRRCSEVECPKWFLDTLSRYPRPDPVVEVWLEKLPTLSMNPQEVIPLLVDGLKDYDLSKEEELIIEIAIQLTPRKPDQGLADLARWLIRLGRMIQDIGVKAGLIEETTVGKTT